MCAYRTSGPIRFYFLLVFRQTLTGKTLGKGSGDRSIIENGNITSLSETLS